MITKPRLGFKSGEFLLVFGTTSMIRHCSSYEEEQAAQALHFQAVFTCTQQSFITEPEPVL